MKYDKWHVTHDMWHVTSYAQGVVYIVSKFQVPSFKSLWFIIF